MHLVSEETNILYLIIIWHDVQQLVYVNSTIAHNDINILFLSWQAWDLAGCHGLGDGGRLGLGQWVTGHLDKLEVR